MSFFWSKLPLDYNNVYYKMYYILNKPYIAQFI